MTTVVVPSPTSGNPSQAQSVPLIEVYDYVLAPGAPSGSNAPGLKGKAIKATLQYDRAESQAPDAVTWLSSGPVFATTDQNGFWHLFLVPNNKIAPTGTYYTIEIEGQTSYKIVVSDVGAPAIGWQSSAIVIDTPPGLGVSGFSLPGGTTVLGNFQINGSIVVLGGNPHYDVSHTSWAGGALGNGVADDAGAIKAAASAANAAGGGEIWFPPTLVNVYGIKSALTIYANVTYHMVAGTLIRWIGGNPGVATYMLGCVAVLGAHLLHVALYNVTLDAGSNGNVSALQLDSVWWGWFENVSLINCNGGVHGDPVYALKMLASVGADFNNNVTGCTFTNLRIDSCRRGIQFFAANSTTGSTNNFFYGLSMICSDAWIDFQQWCDSNYIEDYIFGAAFDSDGTFRGVTCGPTGGADVGVHSERFANGSMDFNTSGMVAAIAIVFNNCASIMFEMLFSGIGGVGGQVTFENGTLFQDNAAANYRIEWINQAFTTANNRTIIFEKGRRWLSAAADVNGVAITGAATGNPALIAAAAGGDANASLGVNGIGTGGVSLNWHRPNRIDAFGAASGSAVQFQAQGVDADIPFHVTPKGNGEVRLAPQNANYLAVFSAAASGQPQLVAQGSDTNITVQLNGKGTGAVVIGANQANFVTIFGAAAASSPNVQAQGSDTNIHLFIKGKGTGLVQVGGNQANFINESGAGSGSAPFIAAGGSDTNVGLNLAGQGTGIIQAGTQFANFLGLAGAAAAAHPQVQALGSDTNINLRLTPKGTGIVDFVYATTALGGGAAPTVGTIGGTGPAAAAQNSWLKVRINGTDSFIPIWR